MKCCACDEPAAVAITCEYRVDGRWETSPITGPRHFCVPCADRFEKPECGVRVGGGLVDAWRMTVEAIG